MIRHRRSATTAALLLTLAAASPASAAFFTYNLIGTWTGTIKCNDFAAGAKQKTTLPAVLRISQSGLNFGVELTSGAFSTFYGGLTNPDVKKPEEKGEAILIRCGTSDQLDSGMVDELVRLSASTKLTKVKATLKGFSFVSNGDTAILFHSTCKWKLTRTDPIDPNFATSCAQNGLQAGGAK